MNQTVNMPKVTKNKGGRNGLIDLTDRTFTKLLVIRRATAEEVQAQGGWNFTSARWLCKCQCGEHKIVLGSNLLNGSTKSCGASACRIRPHEFNERPRSSRGVKRKLEEADWTSMKNAYGK